MQVQATRPPPREGVRIIVTAVPTAAALPVIVMIPAAVTEPPVMRPAVVTVKPEPALASVLSVVAFSAMVVLKRAAPNTNSETLARSHVNLFEFSIIVG